MTLHRVAGAVLFRSLPGGAPLFLLIRNAKGHWDFPKGHVERGEGLLRACRREVREESGLRLAGVVRGFRHRMEWRYREGGERHRKIAVFFLARPGGGRLRLSREHTRGGWYALPIALRKLKYAGQKGLLRSAGRFLARRGGA